MFKQTQAKVGEITRKFIGDPNADTSVKSAELASRYRIPIIACKSYVEVDDGEIVDEDELAEMIETIKSLTEIIRTIATNM